MPSNSSSINLVVPAVMHAVYSVPLAKEPADPQATIEAAISANVAEPHRSHALKMLRAGTIQLVIVPTSDAPAPPVELLRARGAAEELITRLQNAAIIIAFIVSYRPSWPPLNILSGKAACAALALQEKSGLLDGREMMLCAPDKVLGEIAEGQKTRQFSSWLSVVASQGDDGNWLTTKGMYLVGIPELQARQVPAECLKAMVALITGLAWKLVQDLQEQNAADKEDSKLQLSSHMRVSAANIDEAYGREGSGDKQYAVHLEYEAQTENTDTDFLNIVPPPDFAGSRAEYFQAICF